MARPHRNDRDLQGAGGGPGGAAEVEPGGRPAGRFDGARRRVQGGVLLSGGTLFVLEERVGARARDGDVWREFYDRGGAGKRGEPGRSLPRGVGGSGGDAAEAALLQTGDP